MCSSIISPLPLHSLLPGYMADNEINLTQQNDKTETLMGKTTQMELVTGVEQVPPIIPTTLPEYRETQPYQDICDFLAKPVYMNTISFPTSSSRGDLLYTNIIASNVLPGGQPYWLSKLAGFYSFSATFCVDIVINATPFHAGALLINYFPDSVILAKSKNMHARDLCGQSQLPGSIVCNINQNHYSLKIPFITTAEMFVLNGDEPFFPDWGAFNVWVWSPLKTGASGTNNITCSVWGHWEDVILGPVYPQSSAGKRRKVKSFKVSPTSKEESAGGGVSLSGALSKLSVTSDYLKDIPILGPVAGAVSWATGIASGVAKYFGYAKPRSLVTYERHLEMLGQYAPNGTGSDESVQLMTQYDAASRIIEEKTIYPYDEMSINFIKTRPAYWTNFTYYTSDTGATQIDMRYLRIEDMKTTVVYDTQTCTQYTPIGMLANVFYQYTGGVILKLKFFKTAFHAGTLAFSFVPGYTHGSTYSFNQLATTNRYIVDIQTEDELILEIPYQIAYPNEYSWIRLGGLFVHTVTPLRAPETVSQSIDITMEVLGADDLTFYNPRATLSSPIICQGATEDVGESTSTIIGGANTINDVIQVSQDCIGEQINSIKQLLMRSCRVQMAKRIQTTGQITIANNLVASKMWQAGPHTSRTPDAYGTYIDYFAFCYAFRRGSTRWRVWSSNNNVPLSVKSQHDNAGVYVNTAIILDNEINNSDASYFAQVTKQCTTSFPVSKHGAAIQMPFMHIGVISPNEPYFAGEAANQPTVSFTVLSDTSAGASYTFCRSVADDFQFKFWIGVPLMTTYAIN
jgi:hypothetical protein